MPRYPPTSYTLTPLRISQVAAVGRMICGASALVAPPPPPPFAHHPPNHGGWKPLESKNGPGASASVNANEQNPHKMPCLLTSAGYSNARGHLAAAQPIVGTRSGFLRQSDRRNGQRRLVLGFKPAN